MTMISSEGTWFYKKLFPAIWFGFLALFIAATIGTGAIGEAPVFLIVPSLMGVFGFFLMKALVWDLVDEVWDGGEYLVVKNGQDEDQIQLSDIMNVNSASTNPPRITLQLVRPSKFGQRIVFSPPRPFSLNPFASDVVAEDLIVRVHRARTEGAG